MKPALIVTHLEDRHTGLVRASLERAGLPVLESNPLDGAPVPSLDEISGIVSLGGRMSATEIDRHPFLAAEVDLMRDALAVQLPILGMCLGAQLLAMAADGCVSRMERMYVGWPELSLAPAAAEDLVFGGLPDDLPMLKWHEDMIEVPEGAVVLGTTTSPGAALFRVGAAAWGSQMHLELTPPMLLDGWLAETTGIIEIEGAGYDIDAFRADSGRCLQAQMAASQPVFVRFGRLVATAPDARSALWGPPRVKSIISRPVTVPRATAPRRARGGARRAGRRWPAAP